MTPFHVALLCAAVAGVAFLLGMIEGKKVKDEIEFILAETHDHIDAEFAHLTAEARAEMRKLLLRIAQKIGIASPGDVNAIPPNTNSTSH